MLFKILTSYYKNKYINIKNYKYVKNEYFWNV
jgi:hypothetical protein